MKKTIEFSIVIPVLNEEDNIPPLIFELEQALQGQGACEVIFVDDHSSDQTSNILRGYSEKLPWLNVIRLNKQSGQSAALRCGVKEAAGPLIVTLDGDGQNDPADIKHFIDIYYRLSKQNTCCLVILLFLDKEMSPFFSDRGSAQPYKNGYFIVRSTNGLYDSLKIWQRERI
jgi:glycosyltransferase involved in cell wall biosynthesis